MSQWGQRPYAPNQQRPPAQWGNQQHWVQPNWQGQRRGGYGAPAARPGGYGAPTQWQGGYGAPPQRPGYGAPQQRGGSGKALRWLIIAIAAIIGGMLLVNLISEIDDTDQDPQTPPGEYQNEDYQVPPVDTDPPSLPLPETYEEATQYLVNNSIYEAEIAVPVRCDSPPIDLATASDAQLQAHFNELTGCLMRVFGPAVESSGFTLVRPSVTIYSGRVNTPCGTMPAQNAAYCAADQQVYYAANLPDIIPSQLAGVPYVVESVVAHEFAHAIQARTGILISEAAWEQNSTESIANNFSRRLEVQADCWSGQFIESVAFSVGIDQQDAEQLSVLFYSIGDDVLTGDPNIDGNHGHGQSRQNWFWTGYNNTSMGTCNTFTASDESTR